MARSASKILETKGGTNALPSQAPFAAATFVKTVNGQEPDPDGDVTISVPATGDIVRPTRVTTAASPVLTLTDIGGVIEANRATAITLLVPTNANVPIPIGTEIEIVQMGAGPVTVVGDTGVVVNASNGASPATSGQYEALTIRKSTANGWVLTPASPQQGTSGGAPDWAPNITVKETELRVGPAGAPNGFDGAIMRRNAGQTGPTRATFDATEQALWTILSINDDDLARAPTQVAAGDLGATYALDMTSTKDVQVTGRLTANATVNVSGLSAGARAVLLLRQDATGGRTLSVDDGSGALAVPVATAPGAAVSVELTSPNGTDLYVTPLSVPGPTGQTGIKGDKGDQGTVGPSGSGITVTRVTTLPASPTANQVIALVLDDTAGLELLLRWDATKNLWRSLSNGIALSNYVAAPNGGAAIALTAAFAVIPGGASVTLPNVGSSMDIVIETEATAFCSTTNSAVLIGPSIGGAAPAATEPTLQSYGGSGSAAGTKTMAARGPISTQAPGAVITQQAKTNGTNGNWAVSQVGVAVRILQIRP